MNSLFHQQIFCPASFQIKLAISRRKSRFEFLRPGFPALHRRNVDFLVVKSTGVDVDGEGVDRRTAENSSWISLSSAADGFSGWGVDRNGDVSKSKQTLVGILGVGLAGVLIFAGLTFAVISLSNRINTKRKPTMLPLTAEHETSYSSSENQDQFDVREGGDNVVEPESIGEESVADTASVYRESSLPTESGFRDDADVRRSSEIGDGYVLTSYSTDSSQILVPSDEKPFVDVSHDSTIPTNRQSNSGRSPGEISAEELLSDSGILKSPFSDDGLKISGDGHRNGVPNLKEYDSNNSILSNTSGVVQPSVTVFESETINVVSVDSGTLFYSSNDAELGKGYPDSLFTLKNSAGEGVKSPPKNPNLENDYDAKNLGQVSPLAGIPAPSIVSTSLLVHPGKVLVPALVDQLQSQALSALQVLKVIEDGVKPGDLCTRREYARWLVLASSVLSRNTTSKVHPAMYIENVTELAFDDITPADPDFPSIQGLAEAGLISSKLSRRDLQQNENEDIGPFFFSPESPLSRQDLVTWRMALDKRQLPVVEKKTLQQLSGFIDIDKIDPDAWPALVADLAAGEQGIVTLAFGYTRLFQPEKPVTKSQAAIALSTGDACATVSEELARIEAESMAENAVAAHNALVAQVENDLNENYEKELSLEREKINAVERLAEEARREIEKLKSARDEESLALVRERAAVDSEMELLSRLKREVQEHLQSVMADKLEVSYEKERLNKLRRDAEAQNQGIARLQYELDVERKALSMTRAWAEDEAKRAREQAKALDDARSRWESRGLKIVVDKDLSDEANAGVTWLMTPPPGEEEEAAIVGRSENLARELERMAGEVGTEVRATISRAVDVVKSFVSNLKKLAAETRVAAKARWDGTVRDYGAVASTVKDGAKRIAGDWKEGIDRLSHRFKT